MIRRPPRSTQSRSSAASDVYKRQHLVRSGEGARVRKGRTGAGLAPAHVDSDHRLFLHGLLCSPDELARPPDGLHVKAYRLHLRLILQVLEAVRQVDILSLIHISEPTRLGMISYAVFC